MVVEREGGLVGDWSLVVGCDDGGNGVEIGVGFGGDVGVKVEGFDFVFVY